MSISKKIYNTFLVSLLFLACNSKADTNKKEGSTNTSLENNELFNKGLQLVLNNNCLACHKINEKLTGPSYNDIASKYQYNKENVAMLASKIIKGSQGVWGAMVMPAQATISQEDALQMASYILQLQK